MDQCIGDTMGPGGVLRTLRHIPELLEIANDMRELCPKAIFFNYANPMAMCCWALGRAEVIRHFGYFMTKSTGHLSKYLPYFRKNKKAVELYCDEPAFGGETRAYYKYCAILAKKFANRFMKLAAASPAV